MAPCENIGIYYVFVTFGRPGPTFFAPRTGVRSREGPGPAFSLFLAPPVRKSDAEGGQRVPNVTPNAPKSPPGDFQKSTLWPQGVPWLSREVWDMPRDEKIYVFIVICAAGACENI